MVKIRNIIDHGNTVSMDCLKEGDSSREFKLVISREGDILDGPEQDMYSSQARARIWDLLRSGKQLPSETSAYWA